MSEIKKYTVRQSSSVVMGLERVEAGNANLLRIVPEIPLDKLDIGEHTWGRTSTEGWKDRELFFIIREE